MGLPEAISADPMLSVLLVVVIGSVLVMLFSGAKAKLKAGLIAGAAIFGIAFLYSSTFRDALIAKLGINFPAGRLAIGIREAGANAFLWTPEMTSISIVGFGLAFVVAATGSRKLGGLIAAVTGLFLIAKAWAVIAPIVQALS